MFLHAGGNVVIRNKDIVGIFDIDNMNTPRDTKEFLRKAEKEGRISLAGDDLPKSFLVASPPKAAASAKTRVVLCQISAQRLYKRAVSQSEARAPSSKAL